MDQEGQEGKKSNKSQGAEDEHKNVTQEEACCIREKLLRALSATHGLSHMHAQILSRDIECFFAALA